MLQFLQTLQISLFAISILGLLIMGLLILIKPVFICHRRWLLLVFVPLLLANPLSLIEELALTGEMPSINWRLLLVMVVDLGLIIAGYWIFSGWFVHGLTIVETEIALKDWFKNHGWSLNSRSAEKSSFWGGKRQAKRLEMIKERQSFSIWLTAQGSEIRLEGENGDAKKQLRQALPILNQVERPYHFQEHLAGALYLVLGIVIAVLGWIFFFEPRLILID